MSARCPFCRSQAAQRVRFTPWGGIIGPFLLSLRRCLSCGGHFNGRTGRCVKKTIPIYTLIALIMLAVLLALAVYHMSSNGPTRAPRGVAVANAH